MKFKKIESRPSFPKIAEKVMNQWKDEKTFEQSLDKNKTGGQEYIFYDGPPFPTGNPHHGTIFVSILKDVIPRYKTMQGFYVPRVWGWDCHGLPIETQAEKALGITDKREIESTIGVDKFNAKCREIVSNFNDSWRIYIDKLGRWVDFDNAYMTLDRDFMESVIWSFSESYKKGLIYKDYRVNPYCYRCETPLSISDTRSDDSTRPRQDRTVTVKFKVNELDKTYILAWTTTPWTLPSNLALAVGEELEYSFVKLNDEVLIIATDLIVSYKKELGNEPEVLKVVKGKELLGKTYEPLLPYFKDQKDAFKVISADFVTTAEGTGIVHMAPAFGEDDYWTCRSANIELVSPVDDSGRFTEEVSDFAGENVHEANSGIIKLLKSQEKVLQDRTYEHNYPHCWRCRQPLIYKAVNAWYFNVEKVKKSLIKANADVNWYPESVKEKRFGKWLENARDWNISRNRYWATPLPVWECDTCENMEVFSSAKEIEKIAGKELPDLHKEFLDPIEYACKCSGNMKHVPEVLDGWWESGSMPYGQFHYPFENKEHFESHFPADFIVEYAGQIRCWFYYLHVLSTALFEKPAFQNCLVTGTLLANDGKKISKSLKNYTDPMELMDKFGPDALRAYLLSSPAVQMADLAFKDSGVEGMVKSILLPLWNALSFFTTYAEIDEVGIEDLAFDREKYNLNELDLYILSETEKMLEGVTNNLESYALHSACQIFPEFLDTLNNWYIRRSRERVWGADKRADPKMAFYMTLHRVLSKFTLAIAPFCPFIAEEVWKHLGNTKSIHLENWPEVNTQLISEKLSSEINVVRDIISSGLAIRAREQIRVRQPLSLLKLSTKNNVSSYFEVIKEELNVKDIEVLSNPEEIAKKVVKPNASMLGRKFGKDMQGIIKAAKAGEYELQADGNFTIAGFEIAKEAIEIQYVGLDNLPVESTLNAVVSLDINITPELELEGNARDLVRQIQELRKEADLNISDRIILSVNGLSNIMDTYSEYVMKETLTTELKESLSEPILNRKVTLAGIEAEISFKVA